MANGFYDQYSVLLSAPTPLYAPVYLASAERLTHIYKWIKLEYVNLGAQASLFKHAPLGSALMSGDDPLFHELLNPQSHNDCLAAIGDPLRLREVTLHSGYQKPVVIGSVIQKMCFWLVDELTNYRQGLKLGDSFEKVFVHPTGMTSYFLAFYDMVTANGTRPPEEVLFDDVEPGYEREWYDAFTKKSGSRQSFAYITANNFEVSRSSASVKRRFLNESCYDDVMMTAVITREDYFKEKADIIAEFIDGIERGVRLILEAPKTCARKLLVYQDERRPFHDAKSRSDIIALFEQMASAGAYNSTSNLAATKTSFERAFNIRAAADAHIKEAYPDCELKDKATLEAYFTTAFASPITRTSKSSIQDELSVIERDAKDNWTLRRIAGFSFAALSILVLFLFIPVRPSSHWTELFSPWRDALLSEIPFRGGWFSLLPPVFSVLAVWCAWPDLIQIIEARRGFSKSEVFVYLFPVLLAIIGFVRCQASWETTIGVVLNFSAVLYVIYTYNMRNNLFSGETPLKKKWRKLCRRMRIHRALRSQI